MSEFNLNHKYKIAAQKAFFDGISAENENDVISWIQQNCSYHQDHEWFLFFGISCELAKIESRQRGFNDNIDEAWQKTMEKPGNKEKHEKWLKHNR